MVNFVRFWRPLFFVALGFGFLELAGCGQNSPRVPQINWPTPSAIPYGTPLTNLQLDATTTVEGTFTYTPSMGAVLALGQSTLSVTFTPANTSLYTGATAKVSLNVTQATPQIDWTPKDPIAVRVPIGPAQLDAVAVAPYGSSQVTVDGSFLYSPEAGTVFNSSGMQTLTLTFTPTDTAQYSTVQTRILQNVSSFGVVAWGDSLTYGNEGSIDAGAYPTELGNLLLLPVVNEGVKGNTSTEIGVRQGGVATYATVAGEVIPASGGVTVTFPKGYEPVTLEGPAGGTSGTILGIHGSVTIDSTGTILTFTPTTPGTDVSAPGSPQFVVDTPDATYLPVFWEGHDNYNEEAQVLSDLAAQVATVPSGQDYLVMSVTNDNREIEWIGGSSYKLMISLNNQMASTYGSHFLDIRKVLVDSYNQALITDVSDYQHDEPPTSLRGIVIEDATLGNAVGPGDTTLTISTNLPSALLVGYILTIDSGANAENVYVTAVSGNSVTVERNFGGNDTSHAFGVPVVETDPIHLNAQGYQIVANAVAQYLSAYEN